MVPPADTLAELEHRIARLIGDPATAALDAAARAIPGELAESGPALALRGELLRRGGDAEGAARLLAAAIERAPALLGAYHALALARIRAGDRAGARAAWLALLERDPDDATARYQVALAFHEDGDRAQAARWYEAQVARHPSSPKAWHNLGLLRLAARDAGGAVAALREAVACAPASAPAWTALGRALERAGDTPAAIGAWTRAHALDPRAVEPLERHAAALGERAALPAAIAMLRAAVAIDARKPSLRFALAAHLSSLGEHADALAELRAGVALAPGDAAGYSALLFELQYDDTLATREAIADEHRRWADRHADRVPAVHRPARTRPPGRMRIGYLSPRFGMGPLATLFLPVLERHDRTRVEIVLYSSHAHDGPVNARIRAAADDWRDLPRDDASAAAVIADDDLDLLVDLAGHAPGHRLGVLARRPAPLQASWLDYFETTGMDGVDYFLSDATCTPASDAPLFRERLVLLPCRFAYRPLDPPRSPLRLPSHEDTSRSVRSTGTRSSRRARSMPGPRSSARCRTRVSRCAPLLTAATGRSTGSATAGHGEACRSGASTSCRGSRGARRSPPMRTSTSPSIRFPTTAARPPATRSRTACPSSRSGASGRSAGKARRCCAPPAIRNGSPPRPPDTCRSPSRSRARRISTASGARCTPRCRTRRCATSSASHARSSERSRR
ncbi:MAG: tetratricopeptide repeat protein [Betaproteobacteria bacterium]|nr:tetratricopeptide repeat protein [Betaproteobacteria bacterium]